MTKIIMLLISSLSLYACSQHHSNFSLATPGTANTSVIYIYRPASFSNIIVNPQLQLDGKMLFSLENGTYHSIQLPVGRHHFSLVLEDRYQGNHSLTLDTLANQHYFLRLDTQLKFEKNQPYTRRFDLLQVDSGTALNEIRETRSIEKENTDTHEDTAIDNQPPSENNEYFSTSKTRNPFAR